MSPKIFLRKEGLGEGLLFPTPGEGTRGEKMKLEKKRNQDLKKHPSNENTVCAQDFTSRKKAKPGKNRKNC